MAIEYGRANGNIYKPKMNFGNGQYNSCSRGKRRNGDYPEKEPPKCIPQPPPENKHNDNLFEEILGEKPDTEKLLIAALIFLLLKEKADMKLIIALGYILL